MSAKKKSKSSTKKKKTDKRKTIARASSILTKADRDAISNLTKNNVELQKVSIQLAESNDKLVNKISDLIGLFEEAAKNVGVIDELKVREETQGLSERLDTLLQQNRDLAKGLLLLEQFVKGRTAQSSSGAPIKQLNPRPLPLQ